MSATITASPTEAPPDPKRWIALTVVLFAAFMDLLDVTIVNIAIPEIQSDLGATIGDITWIAAGYGLTFAVVLITGGRLGDIYGRKKVFLIGMAGFTLASALCGMATSPGMLIGGRVVQGLFGAVMVPQVLAIIHVTFPPHERGKVFGMFGAIVGMAAVSGPILGGLIIGADMFDLDWRPIFLVNIPVGILAMIATVLYVRDSKSDHAPKLDIVGTVLVTVGLLLLVFPLMQGRERGWPAWIFVMMAASVPVLAAFVWYERRKTAADDSPLINMNLFRVHSFASGLSVTFTFQIVMGIYFLVWTLYMQLGLGWSALKAGVTGVPFSIGVSAAAALSIQFLVPKLGRKVLHLGAGALLLGFLGYAFTTAHYGPDVTPWEMIPALLLMGVGMGLIVAPITDLILTDVPRQDAGSASGVMNANQQLGGAVGVALAGVFFFNMVSGGTGDSFDKVEPKFRAEFTASGMSVADQDRMIWVFRQCSVDSAEAAEGEVPDSCKVFGQPEEGFAGGAEFEKIQKTMADLGREVGARSFGSAFKHTLWILAGGTAAVFALMFALPKRGRKLEEGEEPVLTH